VTVLGWITILIIGSAIGLVGLIASFIFTNPLMLGPAGVTVWFVGVFLLVSSLLTLGLYAAKNYLRLHSTGAARLRYSWRQGLLLGGWLVGMASLSSLRQLGPLDAILLGILLVIVEVYVRFRWP
jgi:hypothetical protein